MSVGHIRNIDSIIIAGGGIEIAAGRFDFLADGTFRARCRTLEDHVLENMADPCFRRLFVGRSGSYIKPGGYQRKPCIFQDKDRETVGQTDNLFLFAGEWFRSCVSGYGNLS